MSTTSREEEVERQIINVKHQIELFKWYYNPDAKSIWTDFAIARFYMTDIDALRRCPVYYKDLSKELKQVIRKGGETGVSRAELISYETWEIQSDQVFEEIEKHVRETIIPLRKEYQEVCDVLKKYKYVMDNANVQYERKITNLLGEKLESKKLVCNPSAVSYFENIILSSCHD